MKSKANKESYMKTVEEVLNEIEAGVALTDEQSTVLGLESALHAVPTDLLHRIRAGEPLSRREKFAVGEYMQAHMNLMCDDEDHPVKVSYGSQSDMQG